jgi:acetyl esterase/lipase
MTFSLYSRLFMKPMMRRGGSVEKFRGMASRLDRRLGRPPAGTEIVPAPLTHCDADWLLPGSVATDRVVLFLPGGAFIVRTPQSHRQLAARIGKAAHARVLVVFYRLAPEHPFPAGLEDAAEAYRRLLAEGVSPARICIGGDSAGGSLTLALLHALRDQNLPMPAGAFAISPMTDLREHSEGSRTSNDRADPMIPGKGPGMGQMGRHYTGGRPEFLDHPHVSPVLGDFAGFPPLLVHVGSTEVLLDDAQRAVAKARQAGVDAEIEIWRKMPHAWHGMNLPESRKAIAHLGDFIRRTCP